MAGRKIQLKRGALASLPTLDIAEMAMTLDTGNEKLHIGSANGNIEIAKKVDLDTVGTNLATEVATRIADKADNATIRKQQIDRRGIQDSIISLSKSKAGYDDTSSTIFTESWADLTAWAALSGIQVSGGKLYGTGVGGGSAGANHAFALASNQNLRAVFKFNYPSIGTSGGVMLGVSEDAVGVAPTVGGTNFFGLYIKCISTNAILRSELGVTSATVENPIIAVGDYIVTVTVDEVYISVSLAKTDGTIEACCRRLRAGFNVNNLFVFNNDTRGLTGMSISSVSARASLQTITPRTFGEGQAKTIQWTGSLDMWESYRIYLPPNYDSRIPCPVAICFHGNGSDETQWSINGNYTLIQKSLVSAGYIVLTCSYTNHSSWGIIGSTNAYYQAYLYVKNHYAISSVVFFANSMGGIESLNALSENLIPCVAWVGTSPTYNLLDNYNGVINGGIFKAVIQSAYGIASDGSNYTAQTLGRDPSLMSPVAFRCIPMLIISAMDDASVSKVNNGDALAASVSNTSLLVQEVSVASGGHSFDVTPYITQIVAFFNQFVSA